jgi:hypothetical protein
MTRRSLLLAPTLALAAGTGAFASPPGPTGFLVPGGAFVLDGADLEAAVRTEGFSVDPVLEDGAAPAAPSLAASVSALAANPYSDPQATVAPRPLAFEYSDGYYKRLKIHKYASYATIPLFAAQFAVGQKLYNGDASDGMRSAHTALAASTGVLFGVNTVTGVWNLLEARKDPHKSTKKTVHGILMLVADAGFVATGVMTPEGHESELGFEQEGGGTSRSTHRAVALTSMGIATVAYLMMLIH